MSTITINIKWNKELFKNVEVNLSESAEVLKSQIFSLTSVPPAKQKVMVLGGQLKDDADLSKHLKNKQTIMVVGTAEKVIEVPKEKTVFIEDTLGENATTVAEPLSAGLFNLGNTCYMNSTLQCLRSVPELYHALNSYAAVIGEGEGADVQKNVNVSMKKLVTDLNTLKSPIFPILLLKHFRLAYPQFAQQDNTGKYMQQDAEECWTQLLTSLNTPSISLPNSSKSAVQTLFQGQLSIILKCDESEEESEIKATENFLKLCCHISINTNYLLEGLKEGLTEKIEKQSDKLGRSAIYTKVGKICQLPYLLTVQFVRFFWRKDTKNKAKVLRPVDFPFTLDLIELCTDELKLALQEGRKKREIQEAKKESEAKRAKHDNKADSASSAAGSTSSDSSAVTQSTESHSSSNITDTMEIENLPPAEKSYSNNTGMYELFAIVSHKGRDADGGHYVAWIKQDDGRWFKFDDEHVLEVDNEEIKKLVGNGGGDWHIAYQVLYRSINV